MRLFIKKKNQVRLNRLVEWLIYMIGYTIVFIMATSLFNSAIITGEHLYLTAFVIECVIYVLNNTIKPLLVKLTIPITALTFGLFYPCINLFILKLADWIVGPHFVIKSFLPGFFLALLISLMNFLVNEIIKSILKRVKHG